MQAKFVTDSGGAQTQTDYVLDAQSVVEEIVKHRTSSTASWGTPTTISYLQGPQGPLYRLSSAATDPSWYVYDGLGSVVGEVSVTGTLTASESRDVYGNLRTSAGTSTTSHGFVGGLGHQTDEETGLVYMRARYYDPQTGRFVSEDPAGHGLNWFAYCDDDPVNHADPTGKFAILIGLGIIVGATLVGAALGGLVSAVGAAAFQLAKDGKLDIQGIWEAALTGAICGAIAGFIGGICACAGGAVAALEAAASTVGYVAKLTAPLASFFAVAVAGSAIVALGSAIAGLVARQVEDAGAFASMEQEE